jgi:FkbM family methyltransferase
MINALLAEWSFLNQFRRENGFRGYLEYRRKRLLGVAEPMTVWHRGRRMRVRATGPDLSVTRGAHSEFSVLKHLYSRNQAGVIIDAGGFVGSAALELARLYPKARILTIEPSSENFALLKDNIAGEPRIEAIHAALVGDDAPPMLALQDRSTGPWGYTVASRGAADLEQVPTLAISDLMTRVAGDDLLIFKMDIEGAETALLTPQANWLSRTGVLMIELHERITPGCEAAFFAANTGRAIVRTGGEKFVSIGPSYFAKRMLARVA